MRPVKMVDEAASQRISNECIGTGSMRRAPDAGPSKPTPKSPPKPRKALSPKGRAGQVLVEEVILSVLDQVSSRQRSSCLMTS